MAAVYMSLSFDKVLIVSKFCCKGWLLNPDLEGMFHNFRYRVVLSARGN